MSIYRFRSPESRRPRKLRRAALSNGATLTLATLTLAALSLVAPPAARAGWNGLTRLTADAGQITSIAQPVGDAEHMFLATKTGQVRVLDLATGTLESELFLDIPETDDEAEGGLLGMTFHPDYANNGKLYVTVTVDNGGIVLNPGTDQEVTSPYSFHLREYTAVNGVVDQQNYNTVIEWVKPTAFHHSGWLGFGPTDGLLYLTTGDGGTVWDAGPGSTPGIGNAQDLTDNWMGKVLRIDVGGDDFPDDPNRNYSIPQHNPYVGVEGDDETLAYGLRNPWGASWDRQTGDFWMGDVGQGLREEVNVIPADSAGGENFGWRLREGADPHPNPGGGQPPARNTHPVYDYAHLGEPGDMNFQGNSVVGGFVYRGGDEELNGKYVFADFISRKFWMFDPADPYGTVENVSAQLAPESGIVLNQITTFFEDALGELYIGTLSGNVFRLETAAENGQYLAGDFQLDGYVDSGDLTIWQESYGLESEYGDADGDGDFDGNDFLLWQQNLTPPLEGFPESAAVPEPAAGVLALLALAAAATRRRHS